MLSSRIFAKVFHELTPLFPLYPLYPLYPHKVKLLYLSEQNLRDRLFIQDFVFNYKFKEETLLFHAPFGENMRDTRFVTKRLSSLLSEAMVYNNFLMGDQRDCFSFGENGLLEINTAPIRELLYTAKLLLIGPVVKQNGKAVIGDPLQMLQLARETFEAEETLLFPTKSKSPLAANKPTIEDRSEVDRLLSIYEEESDTLELAYRLRPVRLVSPVNYSLSG